MSQARYACESLPWPWEVVGDGERIQAKSIERRRLSLHITRHHPVRRGVADPRYTHPNLIRQLLEALGTRARMMVLLYFEPGLDV